MYLCVWLITYPHVVEIDEIIAGQSRSLHTERFPAVGVERQLVVSETSLEMESDAVLKLVHGKNLLHRRESSQRPGREKGLLSDHKPKQFNMNCCPRVRGSPLRGRGWPA